MAAAPSMEVERFAAVAPTVVAEGTVEEARIAVDAFGAAITAAAMIAAGAADGAVAGAAESMCPRT